MSKKMKQSFKVTALAAVLLAVYGPVLAEGLENPDGLPANSVSVGIGNWNNDRPQRGVFDGMRDSGAYGLFDADILKRDDATGTWLGLKARNLGLDNRELKGEWLRQGDIGVSLEYSRIPRDNQFTFNTGVTGIGTTRLLVPAAPGTVPGAGTNVELGTVRDRFTAKFFKNLAVGLNFNVSLRNEDKDGTRQWGRGGAPEFAVEPINSTIRLLEATLSYSRDRLQLAGGYYGTSYDNSNKLVITSLSSLAAASFYNLSQPLNNKSHEVFVNGGYDFTPTTRGTFKASYSQATQDEPFPTSTYPGLIFPAGQTPNARAPTHLSGRLDTTLLEAGVTAKPTPKLSVVANLRYRDFADKTATVPVIFATVAPFAPTVYNTPFSYTNKTGKLEATYRLPQSYSLLGGIEYRVEDRSMPNVGTLWVPFRATVNEATYRVQLRKSMSETVNGSLAYLHSDRTGSSYRLPLAAGEPGQDSINPMNIADRKRDKWRAMLDWSPMDKLALQFAIEDAMDNYSGNTYGLQDGTARLYSVDASYQLGADWQIHAWYTRDETQANEMTLNGAITKRNDLEETGDSFGLGVRGTVSGKLKVGGDVEQFRSVNQYKQTLTGGVLAATMVPTPDITNTMLRVKLFAQYAVQKNADVRFNLIHERWKTDDWSWMMFPATGASPFTYGVATDGTMVVSNPKQTSTFAGIRYIYRFQ